MQFPVAGHQTENYLINTEVYEGPLDLLLQLIERAELDITRLSLAQVTNQYLEYLNRLSERDAGEVSAFLVIAAKLIQIKSEALLPRPPERQVGEEDTAEALALQLITYRKFKQAGEWLSNREKEGLRTYLRLATPPKVEAKIDLTGISLNDLVNTAYLFFREKENTIFINNVVTIPKFTIRERIKAIIDALQQFGNSSFKKLLGKKSSRIDMVITFLAILELIKRRLVDAHQDSLFADIELEPVITQAETTNTSGGAENYDLEFIE